MGISLPKAYALVKQPGFPTIKIGTRILIPIEAYKEWLLKTSIKDRHHITYRTCHWQLLSDAWQIKTA